MYDAECVCIHHLSQSHKFQRDIHYDHEKEERRRKAKKSELITTNVNKIDSVSICCNSNTWISTESRFLNVKETKFDNHLFFLVLFGLVFIEAQLFCIQWSGTNVECFSLYSGWFSLFSMAQSTPGGWGVSSCVMWQTQHSAVYCSVSMRKKRDKISITKPRVLKECWNLWVHPFVSQQSRKGELDSLCFTSLLLTCSFFFSSHFL